MGFDVVVFLPQATSTVCLAYAVGLSSLGLIGKRYYDAYCRVVDNVIAERCSQDVFLRLSVFLRNIVGRAHRLLPESRFCKTLTTVRRLMYAAESSSRRCSL